MDPTALKNSLSHGKEGILYDRQFQMEFFRYLFSTFITHIIRAATFVLPHENHVSPDVLPANMTYNGEERVKRIHARTKGEDDENPKAKRVKTKVTDEEDKKPKATNDDEEEEKPRSK